jgi:NTP pyrophosphatase (non-canonical NTP hydrolase)
MLKEAQEAVKRISYEAHKREVFTSSFFVALLAEQVGQAAEKYITEGRLGKDVEVDIADVIVVSLAYLNWLEKDASEAFRKSLEKHEKAVKRFTEKRKK